MIRSRRTIKVAVVLALALVLATVTYAFAAANTVADSGAGDGDGVISGYNITNITFTLNSGDPTKLATVSFDAAPIEVGAPAATDVKVKVNTTGAWVTCAAGTTSDWTCDISGNTVLDATTLQVIAVH